MSPSEPEQTDSVERDELVAYLDGELSSTEAMQVEGKISADDSFRKELQGLDRVWNALDELPQASVDDAFTQTTMEMVALAAREEIAEKTVALPVQRRRRSTLAIVLCVCAVAVGFAGVFFLLPNSNRVVLRNLPIIEAVEVYTQLDSLEFLQELDQELGDELRAQMPPEFDQRVASFREISQESIEARRERILSMSPEERSRLRSRAERYLDSPQEDQAAMRTLHESIASQPNAARLQETLLAYGDWIIRMDWVYREDLRLAEPESRIELIEMGLDFVQSRSYPELSQEDATDLQTQAYDWATDRLVNDPAFKARWDRFNWTGDDVQRRQRLFSRFVTSQIRRELRDRDGNINYDLFDWLVALLSDEALVHLEEARLADQNEQGRATRRGRGRRGGWRGRRGLDRSPVGLLQQWINDAVVIQGSASELEDFFARELSIDERMDIVALPREEQQDALWRLYEQYRFRGLGFTPGGDGRRGDQRGGRGGNRGEESRESDTPASDTEAADSETADSP